MMYNSLGIPIATGALYPIFATRVLYHVFGIRSSVVSMFAALTGLSSLCVAINALRLKNFNKQGEKIMKKTLLIDGMMCMHCAAHIEKALKAVESVSSVVVDLNSKTAVVTAASDVSDAVLGKAVEDAGYTVTDIKGE